MNTSYLHATLTTRSNLAPVIIIVLIIYLRVKLYIAILGQLKAGRERQLKVEKWEYDTVEATQQAYK
jgi:hypothetical protein